jgi:hypothetical protein
VIDRASIFEFVSSSRFFSHDRHVVCVCTGEDKRELRGLCVKRCVSESIVQG